MENNPYTRNNFFTQKAKQEGYNARSVYKLMEIDEKYHLFKKNQIILDLGACPGSWSQYALKKVGHQGKIIGIDIKNIKEPLGKNYHFIHGDIIQQAPMLKQMGHFDIVMSDMAPDTTGIKSQDVFLSHELSFMALEVAQETLKPTGVFICKIFQGEDVQDFYVEIKKIFKKYKTVKPTAVRKNSKEVYVIAQHLKPYSIQAMGAED